MRIPSLRGTIDRRILVNYRMSPETIAPLLPRPFRPKLLNGHAVAGICLIRLQHVRPKWFSPKLGLSSENAAHRIAVEWEDTSGVTREGVYIPRRDTNSRFTTWVGGRLFPGVHHHADFDVEEDDHRSRISVTSDDGGTRLRVEGTPAGDWPASTLFASLDEASRFFRAGSLGYSAGAHAASADGLELRCRTWQMRPLDVADVHSSFFDDVSRFPRGSAAFDCALLMRNIDHEWVDRGSLCCEPPEER